VTKSQVLQATLAKRPTMEGYAMSKPHIVTYRLKV